MSKVTKAEQLEAIETLQQWLKPGDTVYFIVKRVSSTGMSRVLQLLIPVTNDYNDKPGIKDISWLVARACGYRLPKDGSGFIIGGTGMNMGFAAVYDLSRTLFRNNFVCIGKNCPSNDHFNGDKDYSPHIHTDAGYALNYTQL